MCVCVSVPTGSRNAALRFGGFNQCVAEDAGAAPCACCWFYCAQKVMSALASGWLAVAWCVTCKANFAALRVMGASGSAWESAVPPAVRCLHRRAAAAVCGFKRLAAFGNEGEVTWRQRRAEQASPPPAAFHVCCAGLPHGPPVGSFGSLSAVLAELCRGSVGKARRTLRLCLFALSAVEFWGFFCLFLCLPESLRCHTVGALRQGSRHLGLFSPAPCQGANHVADSAAQYCSHLLTLLVFFLFPRRAFLLL